MTTPPRQPPSARRAETRGRRQTVTAAALRYAEGIMAWQQGELAAAEHLVREATMQWHDCRDRMEACDGIELLGVLAAARERFSTPHACSPPPTRPASHCDTWHLDFTANRAAAVRTASQARHILGENRFTRAWEQGQGLSLDDAVTYAPAKAAAGNDPPPAGPV